MKQLRSETSVRSNHLNRWLASALYFLALLVACFAPCGAKAQLPPKFYVATNLPPEIDQRALRLDDAGNVFGASLTLPTKFLIFHPTNGTVQHIPSPLVPNTRRFDLVDINQKGQFIAVQLTRDLGHQFVWTGGEFVELQPPPPRNAPVIIPNFPGTWYYGSVVHPGSIHDDGSIWGTVDEALTPQGGVNRLGAEVRWNLSGTPTVVLSFDDANSFLRGGLRRNEKGSFLRYEQAGGPLIVNAGYWDGQSSTLGTRIPHPPSRAIALNDLDEVAGIDNATDKAWIYLPAANYGLAAGYHTLEGVVVSDSSYSIAFNNAGQIFASTADPAQPRAVWDKGRWRAIQIEDPNNLGLEYQGMSDSNAKGAILATVGPSANPTAWRQAVLTPKDDLAVVSDVLPRQLAIGDTLELILDIRNDTGVPLNNVGIVVSSLGLSGAIVADWIKAPPKLLTLAPGASGTLHYLFRAKAAGRAQLRYQVEGLNAAGQRQTITARIFSPAFTVLEDKGDLLIKSAADPGSQFALDDVYQTIPAGGQIVTNSTTAHIVSQFQIQIQNDGTNSAAFHINAIESGVTGWDIKYFSSSQDISAGVRTFLGVEFPTLAPKQSYLIDVTMTPTNAAVNSLARSQLFLSATNMSGQFLTLDAVEAVSQRVEAVADLLVRRIEEPVSAFGLDNLYQTQPAGLQIRTNMAGQNVLSEFELQIQNDAKAPQIYRLTVKESANDGWKPVRYLFGGQDIGPQLRAPAGFDFPVLGTNKYYLMRVQMTPTNATPGSQFRGRFAVSTTINPAVILDAAEVVTEIPFEIIVNSTGDLPLDSSVTCCCDTGRKLADGVTTECTLRAAIELANQHPGKDTIKFQIPSDDPHFNGGVPRVEPLKALPPITQPVKIDGWSQNTSATKPPIELAGDRLPLGLDLDPGKLTSPDNFPTSLTIYPGGISGLVIEAGNSEIQGLVINRFPFCGIELGGGDNVVQRNYVGTDAAGQFAKGNGRFGFFRRDTLQSSDGIVHAGWYGVRGCGIWVRSPGNIIGGAGQGNLLSGISGSRGGIGDLLDASEVSDAIGMPPDIAIVGGFARGNLIEGNLIGTKFDGLKLIDVKVVNPSYGTSVGIVVATSANFIGGESPGSGNVICSSLFGEGILIVGNDSTENFVQGNAFGTDTVGTIAIGGGIGVHLQAPGNIVGGSGAGAGNVFRAHGIGVELENGANGNTIEGNQFGPIDLPLTTLRPYSGLQNEVGIRLNNGALQSIITNNIIANSTQLGIQALDMGSLSGNLIVKNQIFGTGEMPVGDRLGCTPGLRLSQNSVHDNGLALRLGYPSGHRNVYVNDRSDIDGCQNYPLLLSAVLDNGALKMAGNLSTKLGGGFYRIEFFANHFSPDGYGEGEIYLGFLDLDVGIGGLQGFDLTVPANPHVSVGMFLTANATTPDGMTSEFSKAQQICSGRDRDHDGMCDDLEDRVPNGKIRLSNVGATSIQSARHLHAASEFGDGNGDGISDSEQANACSLVGISGEWITLASPASTALESVSPSGPPDFTNIPAGYTFPLGFVNFSVVGLTPGGSVTVTNFFHNAIAYDTVFAYGPTPDNAQPHWYEFLFDGGTGAELDLNGFTMTFLDGRRGDHDLKAEGQVTTTLAAAYKVPPGPQITLLSTSVSSAPRVQWMPAPSGGFVLATNQVSLVTSLLAWPASATNWFLQYTDKLSSTNDWQTAFGTPAVLNNQNVLTNNAADTARYYRLRRY